MILLDESATDVDELIGEIQQEVQRYEGRFQEVDAQGGSSRSLGGADRKPS